MDRQRWLVPFLVLSVIVFGAGASARSELWSWEEDFEDGAASWQFSSNAENLWHLTDEAGVPHFLYPDLTPFPSPDQAMWFGDEARGSYELGTLAPKSSQRPRAADRAVAPMAAGGGYPYGELISPEIVLPRGVTRLSVSFRFASEVECYTSASYDRMQVAVSFDGGTTWELGWERDSRDCIVEAGQPWPEAVFGVIVPPSADGMHLRFLFDAVDNISNDFLGWLVDDIRVGEDVCSGFAWAGTPCGGKVDNEYTCSIPFDGGTAPYAVIAIDIPNWMDPPYVDAGHLALHGWPIAAGAYPLQLAVRDANGCEIEGDWTIDVGGDGCAASVYFDDFESEDGWQAEGLWHRVCDSPCTAPDLGYASPSCAYYYGQDASCNYSTGAANDGDLISPAISLAGIRSDAVTIRWKYWRSTELYKAGSYDRTRVECRFDGGPWTELWFDDSHQTEPQGGWHQVERDVTLPAGAATIELRFSFDTVDNAANQHVGWLIDDVAVVAPLRILSTCEAFPEGVVDEAYASGRIEAEGGCTPYEWTWTGLPPGLAWQDGGIVGTPTAAGRYTVVGTVTDCCGSEPQTIECTILICEKLEIVTICDDVPGHVPECHPVGEPYALCLEISGGCPSAETDCAWTWAPHVPAGLVGRGCCIEGTPTEEGTFTFTVTVTRGDQTAELTCEEIWLFENDGFALLDLDFEDGLVDGAADAPWTATGLWHVSCNGCAGPYGCEALDGCYAYFGRDVDCTYDTGGVVEGYVTSPIVSVPEGLERIGLAFGFLRDVEPPASGSFDRTAVQIRWDDEPWQTVWDRDSRDPSPECDSVAIGPLDVPASAATLQVRFGFRSVDKQFNGFFGWAVDDVSVFDWDAANPGEAADPQVYAPKAPPGSGDSIGVMNVPNPVRDVHTTRFVVRGAGIEALRIQIYDLHGTLVFEEEAPGTELIWHTDDQFGEYLANGIYIYRAFAKVAGEWIASALHKLVVLR